MTEEHKIQNEIRAALAPYCTIFRMNVGRGYTPDGRYFSTGVPTGFSDLFGHRKSDGKAVYIEVKTKTGKASSAQLHFIRQMKKSGAIAGICRNAEEALNLIGGSENGI